jgi:hypothetical protein
MTWSNDIAFRNDRDTIGSLGARVYRSNDMSASCSVRNVSVFQSLPGAMRVVAPS